MDSVYGPAVAMVRRRLQGSTLVCAHVLRGFAFVWTPTSLLLLLHQVHVFGLHE